MNNYPEIAGWFYKAFGEGLPEKPAFRSALKNMRDRPDLAEKITIWDETLWLLIEEYLNSDQEPESEECFMRACMLLERRCELIER